MKRIVLSMIALASLVSSSHCSAQVNFFSKWEARVRATSAKQPGWAVPVVSPHSGIVQLVRADFVRQYTPTHTLTWNLDNSKGFNFIPWYNTEVDINLPPYIEHNNPKVLDGAGDFSMIAKYRLFASPATKHNYMASFQVAGVGATGSHKNGSIRNSINPTLIAGKGVGKFDVQSALGGTLPSGSINTLGRTIVWNTVAQYQVHKIFWPELEVNSTFYNRGPNDGKNQTFLTPGLMISKLKFRKDPKDRLALVFGAGMQIATSSYHSYNHGLVITSRITF